MPRSASSETGRSRDWRSPAAIRLHVSLVLGVTGCLLAGWFELTRALHGRQVAWVYVFEWPLFAVVGSLMWWRLLAEQPPTTSSAGPTRDRTIGRAGAPAQERQQEPEQQDAGLAAWRRYLADLQRADPPGGPPPR